MRTVAFLSALCLLTAYCSGQDDLGTVIFATLLHRHGDRSPTKTYPNDPYDQSEIWPEGLGELTPIGREQAFELGTYIRERYKVLLSEKYDVNEIYVRSSSKDRCLMTAECSMYGLYPHTSNFTTVNVQFQPVPIHSADRSNDEVFFASEFCPRYSKSLDLLKKSPAYECVMNITSQTRSSIASYAGLEDIYNILLIEELYNLTLPDWTKMYFPEPMKSLHLFDGSITESGTKELQKYSIGPFLGQIISNMKMKSQGLLTPDRKLFVYSGHDGTVYKMLSALNVNEGAPPPYTSSIFLELREKNNNYFVSVSYRNTTDHEPYLLKLPGCEELCLLDTFISLTESVIPKDFETECQEEPEQQVDFIVPYHSIPDQWLSCFPTKDIEKEYGVLKM